MPTIDELDQLGDLEGADSIEDLQSTELRRYLTAHYGNFAPNVIAVLRLWEALGNVFFSWRDEWTSDTTEYCAQRALRFLRAGKL